MSFLSDVARRGYRFVKRSLDTPNIQQAPIDVFPVDAWTDPSYESWFRAHKASPEELKLQREAAGDFPVRPTFSFIVPLYKTPLDYLKTAVDSVLAQTYPFFQLILVNASPEIETLAQTVESYRLKESRITVVTLKRNLGITENTNEGIAAATGDFCCFLDHDDFIEPNLLFEYVRAINEKPETDVLYCDEDLVIQDEHGAKFHHQNPLFKPGFSPELLLCKNYIIHLMTIRTELIRQMPKPDSRYDGSQDYNMVLFCTGKARRVQGVQKVLYHWRISEESTATNSEAKPYGRTANRRAAQNELMRRLPSGRIIASGILNNHNIWLKAPTNLSVSVIVDCALSTNQRIYRDGLERFCEYFIQNNSLNATELVFTGCTEREQEVILSLCERRIVHFADPLSNDATRYARLNAGAAQAKNDFLLFLDTGCNFITPEPLEQLSTLCASDGVGITSPKVLYRDGLNKCYGVAVTPNRVMPMFRGYDDDFPGYECNLRAFQNVSAAPLQGLCTPRATFEALGGFDESFLDELGAVDYAARVRHYGQRIAAMCTVKLEVDEPCPSPRYDYMTNAQDDYTASGVELLDQKWPQLRVHSDPFLNSNLNQSSCYQQIPKP